MLISTDFNWTPKLSTLKNSINFSLHVSAWCSNRQSSCRQYNTCFSMLVFLSGRDSSIGPENSSKQNAAPSCTAMSPYTLSGMYVIYFHRQDKICRISVKFQIFTLHQSTVVLIFTFTHNTKL